MAKKCNSARASRRSAKPYARRIKFEADDGVVIIPFPMTPVKSEETGKVYDTPLIDVSKLDTSSAPPEAEFLAEVEAYICKLDVRKKDKALIPFDMYNDICDILRQPGDTSVRTAQFRFWAKRMFSLGTDDDGRPFAIHKNRAVAIKEQLFGIIAYFHLLAKHPGRDRTCQRIWAYFEYVPKELVAAFVRRCPTCIAKREGGRPDKDMWSDNEQKFKRSCSLTLSPSLSPTPSFGQFDSDDGMLAPPLMRGNSSSSDESDAMPLTPATEVYYSPQPSVDWLSPPPFSTSLGSPSLLFSLLDIQSTFDAPPPSMLQVGVQQATVHDLPTACHPSELTISPLLLLPCTVAANSTAWQSPTFDSSPENPFMGDPAPPSSELLLTDEFASTGYQTLGPLPGFAALPCSSPM